MRAFAGTLVLLALAAPITAAENGARPRLDLRATPRMAFSPTIVYVTAELAGGDEVEDFYCPDLEWDWDDGARSVRGSDCPPFEAGASDFERFFSADHVYRQAVTAAGASIRTPSSACRPWCTGPPSPCPRRPPPRARR